jgi:hypothetical protein
VKKYGIAQPVTRKQDDRLTTGRGPYADDVGIADQAFLPLPSSGRTALV